ITEAIVKHMRDKRGTLIGEPTADRVYMDIGQIPAPAREATLRVKGRNIKSGLPSTIEVSSVEIREVVEAIPDEYVDKFVLAVIRGDMEVNETKLVNAVKAKEMRPATDAEIRAVGAVPGYGSPIGVKDALVVVDDLITQSPNLVAGANDEGYHFLNVNFLRRMRGETMYHRSDFDARIIADIAAAEEGSPC